MGGREAETEEEERLKESRLLTESTLLNPMQSVRIGRGNRIKRHIRDVLCASL